MSVLPAQAPFHRSRSPARKVCVCTRCPYLAISLDKNLHPVTDAERCVGCSLCSLQCFVGAIRMRERTAKEKKK